jgi:hypothetical protein
MRSHPVLLLTTLTTSVLFTACSSSPDDVDGARDRSGALSIVTPPPGGGRIGPPGVPLADGNFYLRALGTRCLDIGGQAWWSPGEPVVLYSCNNSAAQQIRVRELDGTHDVELRPLAPSSLCLGVRGDVVTPGAAIELQPCNGHPSQRFALDGDTILIGKQSAGAVMRDYVIEPAGDDTRARTPLVVGTREVSDAEYFRPRAVDGAARFPTTGFVRVFSEADLDTALTRGWGTVVEIDDAKPLAIMSTTEKVIGAGMTVRGYRKFTDQGPLVTHAFAPGGEPDHSVFRIGEDHVRVTGLRLQGPTRSRDTALIKIHGISIVSPLSPTGDQSVTQHDVMVDHIDASDWTGTAVSVVGPTDSLTCPSQLAYPRRPIGKIIGSFVHHNLGGYGYGACTGGGGYMLVQGTTMYMNLHSIASDPSAGTGYTATDNFITSEAPGHILGGANSDQDMDAHGSDGGSTYSGGVSGDLYDMGWNTFLTTGHRNFDQRGTPCHYAYFHDNVSMHDPGTDAIDTQSIPKTTLIQSNNLWKVQEPTSDLGVGDFDGDGIDDVFVGTGATWWFSSGAKAEWRFLNRMPEHASELRFGDFDGDGRTDVLAPHGRFLQVSWGGVSPWVTITTTGATLADMAVGDFDGDRVSDVFVADGREWKVALGAATWTHMANQTQGTAQLRFGDFNGDGRTDVLGVDAGTWKIVRGGGGGNFEPIGSGAPATMDGLVVADFDGDGIADVARTSFGSWQIWTRASGVFTLRRVSSDDLAALPIGRFDGDRSADVVFWPSLHFGLAPGGQGPVDWMHSNQDMR